jgi:arsenite methyltransferase
MKMKPEDIKKIVTEKYGQIAGQSTILLDTGGCCAASGCCSGVDYTIFSESYDKLEGYLPDADMGLGCGIPTEFARIKEGDTVLDLGSGAGNDCFVARAQVGQSGRVIGLDMTESMISKARENAARLNHENVEFVLGDIENIPLEDNTADVIISNCVLNLVPDKKKTFGEIFRVLKPGAHLSVSDVVLRGQLPGRLKQAAELYAGCISGAVRLEDYLKLMEEAGLVNIKIQKEKAIAVPDEVFLQYIDKTELSRYKGSEEGILSITVYAEKPVTGATMTPYFKINK